MKKSFSAVDLFCGVGGLTHGLIKTGIPVVAGFDVDETCRYAFEKNNDSVFINKDIRDLTKYDLEKYYGEADIRILVGCAPCQCFSKHTQKIKGRARDKKWSLLRSFAKIIAETEPAIVSMENVEQVTSHRIFDEFIRDLKRQGYHVNWKSVFCPDYGIPQKRKRLVLLASKLGPIELIKKTHRPWQYKTVRQTIEKLEPIKAGGISAKDTLHRTRNLSRLNMKRMRQSTPGGTWEDWDKKLIVPCHKKKTGKTYSAVYGRMEWDKPGPTITTQFHSFGTGRFGHPTQDRALSLREGAMLQTFPKSYKFVKPGEEVISQCLGIHIGNAVPVRLGVIIGRSIKKHIKGIK